MAEASKHATSEEVLAAADSLHVDQEGLFDRRYYSGDDAINGLIHHHLSADEEADLQNCIREQEEIESAKGEPEPEVDPETKAFLSKILRGRHDG